MRPSKSKCKSVLESPPVATKSWDYEPILTMEDVAQRLRIEPGSVYELTRRRCARPLPVFRVGKFLRFRWSEIEKWIVDGRRNGRS